MKLALPLVVLSLAAPVAAQAPAAAQAPSNPHAGVGPANPHGGQTIPQNESAVAGDLPSGTIEAFILDSARVPLAKTQVRLGIMFQRISEGESRSEKFAVTDDAGRVRFDGLKIGSDYSYRITVKSGPASYGSMPFNLGEQAGHRVRLYVFPVTSNLAEAPIGLRNLIYVEPRDDVFQFEVMYRIFNVGAVTWVPENVVMALPANFKAFSAQKEMSGAGFTAVDGVGARLEGTFAPGQYDVRFRFQVPKSNDEEAFFKIGLLPRVVDTGVIVEASSQMGLKVEGFREAIADSNPEGKRVLVVRRNFSRGEDVTGFTVELTGLPVPGPGRWIAVLIASALGLTGIAAYRGLVQLESGDRDARDRDLENARELLLAELVEVEKARRAGELGPRAYADARRVLLESLARLGRDALTVKKTKRKAKRAEPVES